MISVVWTKNILLRKTSNPRLKEYYEVLKQVDFWFYFLLVKVLSIDAEQSNKNDILLLRRCRLTTNTKHELK